VDVVRQYLPFDHSQTGALAGARNSDADVTGCTLVNAPDAPPGVPGDVRIHLEGSMS